MNFVTYDCEVFAFDWIVVFKDKNSGRYTVVHNDNDVLRDFIKPDDIYCGFNSKHYDQYIVKAICAGFDPPAVKAVSDYALSGQGWQCPDLDGVYFRFNSVDIRDDMQQGLSLKAIEGHLGMTIRESTVPFDIDRPLTPGEVDEVVRYCMHDVDAAEAVVDIRSGYLRTKVNLGRRAGIGPAEALRLTNAKLTAKMLHAVRREHHDGREYAYPENLDIGSIPEEIRNFFDRIHDMSIPDDELFSTCLDIELGGMMCRYAWGGVHGSLECYHEEASDIRVIQNRDVSSLYPSLIELYGYLSRNVPDPELFYAIRRDRLEAKRSGNKELAKDLKLPLNTVSGAQENKYNDLYDPRPTRSLRISGQLFLTVLTVRLLRECRTIQLLNLNTDGLMYSVDRSELPTVDRISSEWERETKFELEVDDIARVWIRDVNNLLIVKTDGGVKTVGGALNYGISEKGAWAINNNAVIIKRAVTDFFVSGTPVEKTIMDCENILDFQIIAKAGTKYRESYRLIDGRRITTQKVNRVYAAKDPALGTLYKVKSENGQISKIESLPEHCIIDNENTLTPDDINREWYISEACRSVNGFVGYELLIPYGGQINMSEITEKTALVEDIKTNAENSKGTMPGTNVCQKLLEARVRFLSESVSKSGRNSHVGYEYFELEDIVPLATSIFNDIGLVALPSFTRDEATLTVKDTANPSDEIVFRAPFETLDPIVSSRTGKEAMNKVQALGASITYMRRYMWQIALDICEHDAIDGELSGSDMQPIESTNGSPGTVRLTDGGGAASELQISQLKEAIKALLTADPSRKDMIDRIAVKTKGFTDISRSDCENLTVTVNGLAARASAGEDDLPF